jgi:hypothetical protein
VGWLTFMEKPGRAGPGGAGREGWIARRLNEQANGACKGGMRKVSTIERMLARALRHRTTCE